MFEKRWVTIVVAACLVLAVGAAYGNILVANRSTVSEFTDSGQFVKVWATGSFGATFHFAWDIITDPDGNVYVSNQQDYLIHKFAADGTPIMNIETSYGLYPMGMAYVNGVLWDNANGYSASQGWNATTGEYVSRLFWDGDSMYMTLGPDGLLYVSQSQAGQNRVESGDPADPGNTDKVLVVTESVPSPQGLAFYGNDLYIAGGNGSIYKKSGSSVTVFATGLTGTLAGLRVSGDKLYAIEKWGGYGGYGKVSIFDLTTGQLLGYFDNYNYVGGGVQPGGYDYYLDGPNNLLVTVPVVPTPPNPKDLDDTKPATVQGWVVTATFPGLFYMEQPNRFAGIAVSSNQAVAERDVVTVKGLMATDPISKERRINATDVSATGTQDVPGALGMVNSKVGGGPLGQYTLGITGATGLHNMGMLVRTFGKYTYVDAQTFTVDDGSGMPVKCVVPGDVTLQQTLWTYVAVTGASSCYMDGSVIRPLIKVRKQTDIVSF